MRKALLTTAVLVLSSAWLAAQARPGSVPDNSNQQYPAGQQPAAPSAPDAAQTSQQAAPDHAGHSIEGCVAGSAGSYTLTDASGKTYQLAGDTSKLADHVGHSVQAWGSEEASAAGAAAPAGAQPTFTVKKVKMVSSSCPNK